MKRMSPEETKEVLERDESYRSYDRAWRDRGVQVSGTKRGPKSPKFPPKIGLLRWIFDIHLPDTLHPSTSPAQTRLTKERD